MSAAQDAALTNPYRLHEFPTEDQANRGSTRVQALFAGRRPELIRTLLNSLQSLAAAHRPRRYDGFDPWIDARPSAARMKAWGLIQRHGDYEEWRLHPGGWMSGVYYVRVPAGLSSTGGGPGCIEFGPPTSLERVKPGYVPNQRYLPVEGELILAPSHYSHRTIPFEIDEYRISFAFDVVPDQPGQVDRNHSPAPLSR